MKKYIFIASIVLLSSTVAFAMTKAEVSKFGDNYHITMDMPDNTNQKLSCDVVYRKLQNNQYNRELRCLIIESGQEKRLKNTVKVSVETWKNFDTLIFQKYGEYSLWHNSVDSIVKDSKELVVAKYLPGKAECLKKGGKYDYDIVTGFTSCGYTQDMTNGMTAQEKADYLRAKQFEEEYNNYLKNK